MLLRSVCLDYHFTQIALLDIELCFFDAVAGLILFYIYSIGLYSFIGKLKALTLRIVNVQCLLIAVSLVPWCGFFTLFNFTTLILLIPYVCLFSMG